MIKPHILILGSGFGGTYIARGFDEEVRRGLIDITIVNKTNYFLFTPLLHEVATGSLSPNSVAEPIREIFHGSPLKFCQGEVFEIDTENRRVHVKTGQTKHTITYDYLVISTGATTNYYDITGAEQFSLPLKDLRDAVNIRNKVIDVFERASVVLDTKEKENLLSFAVVGAGPTGVEVVTELADFVNQLTKRYYDDSYLSYTKPQIHLVHAGKEILEQLPPKIREFAKSRLEEMGIKTILGDRVVSVNPKGLEFESGLKLSTNTVLWCAGVKALVPSLTDSSKMITVNGRVAVDNYLRFFDKSTGKGDPRVFVLGDVAGYALPESNEKPILAPMLAQVAVAQARIIRENIEHSINNEELKQYNMHLKGILISMGAWFAVGKVGSLVVRGGIAWWLWRTIYFTKFASLKKKFRIAFEWTLNIFYPRDITKL